MEIEITNPAIFQFAKSKFHFGQKVKTIKGSSGYIVGLDFYPETQTWAYGIYVTDDNGNFLDEDWYHEKELEVIETQLDTNYSAKPPIAE